MPEGLTKEAIDHICDLMELHKIIEAIKALRMAWPFGLKDAKGFLDLYRTDPSRPDLIGLRQKLLSMANLTEFTVFENQFLRIEVKKTGASLPEAHRFLLEVLSSIYPSADFKERRAAFLYTAEKILDGVSFDEMNELCASLMKRVAK